jgi:hypothetical protein
MMITQPTMDPVDGEAEMVLSLGAVAVVVDLCIRNDTCDDEAIRRLPVLHEHLKSEVQRLSAAFDALCNAWRDDSDATAAE